MSIMTRKAFPYKRGRTRNTRIFHASLLNLERALPYSRSWSTVEGLALEKVGNEGHFICLVIELGVLHDTLRFAKDEFVKILHERTAACTLFSFHVSSFQLCKPNMGNCVQGSWGSQSEERKWIKNQHHPAHFDYSSLIWLQTRLLLMVNHHCCCKTMLDFMWLTINYLWQNVMGRHLIAFISDMAQHDGMTRLKWTSTINHLAASWYLLIVWSLWTDWYLRGAERRSSVRLIHPCITSNSGWVSIPLRVQQLRS